MTSQTLKPGRRGTALGTVIGTVLASFAGGANALEFSVSAIVSDFTKAGAAQTDLRMRILKAFRAEGIEMPFAQHDVHLRDLDMVRQILMRVAEERAGRGTRGAGPTDQVDG